MRFHIRGGLRVEEVGADLIVLDASGSVVHRVSGVAVDAFRLAAAGPVDSETVPAKLLPAMEQLAEAGVLDTGGWTRRKVLIAGALGIAGASVTSLALPEPAAAASTCDAPALPLAFNSSGTFQAPADVTSVRVHVWAAGGGGGSRGPGGSLASPGGGGGAYASSVVDVEPCATYSVIVGIGGAGSTTIAAGGDGGLSSFGTGLNLVVANGGKGGTGVSAGSAGGAGGAPGTVSGTQVAAHNGGTGGSRANVTGGGGGGSGGHTGDGGNGGAPTAGTAGPGSPGGASGGQGGASTQPGSNGNVPGGGGGGHGASNNSSGSGAGGRVTIEAP